MDCFGSTDIGKRRALNQDCFRIVYAKDFLISLVCDGMGGANGGNIASAIAADVFCTRLSDEISSSSAPSYDNIKEYINNALIEANRAVYEKSKSDPVLDGMGSTLVAFVSDGKAFYTANIGDSRAYYIPSESGEIIKLTKDHSLVQSLIDSGIITEDEAAEHPNRNIIMRAVGVDEIAEPDIISHNLCGGRVLLCSDGLSGYFHFDDSYKNILTDMTDPENTVNRLIEYANRCGGSDNITAVIIRLQS